MNKKLTSVKNHVVRNRGRYCVAATALVLGAAYRAQVREMNTFLKEHNLFDEYYTPEA